MSWIKDDLLGLKPLSERLVWLQRKETWAGDMKANFIRFIGLGVFTINEMLNYYVFQVVDKTFHMGAILVIFIWFAVALDFHVLLKRHWIPKFTPFLMPALDLFLVTWLLFLADGPKSPLVVLYFLVVALAGIRLNPRIALFTAGAASFAYLSAWDFTKHQKPEFLVPLSHVVIVILALWLMGIIIAHLIGRFYSLLEMTAQEKA